MQKTEIRKQLDAYLATRLEDDETFEDIFWHTCYPDDIPYEVSEALDHIWLPFEVKASGWEWDYYVEVFAYINYVHKWLLLNNNKDIDEFVFEDEDELINWIDEIQEDFINVQEELKQHFTS